MQNPIRILERIQKVDIEIGAVEEEQSVYHRDIDRAFAEIKEIDEAIAALSSEIEGLKTSVRASEEQLRECGEKVSKNEKRIGEIKNDRELKALTKETNEAKKKSRLAEEELKHLQSRLSDKESEAAAKEAAKNEKNSLRERLTGELEEKKTGWAVSIAQMQSQREVLKADVRPDILRRYETIRAKRGGRAVVPVRDEACQGCFIHIPPQVYLQIKRGDEELFTCPHCHRILFVENQTQPETV